MYVQRTRIMGRVREREKRNIAAQGSKKQKARILFRFERKVLNQLCLSVWVLGMAVCLVRELIGKTGRVKGMPFRCTVMVAFFKRHFDNCMFNL